MIRISWFYLKFSRIIFQQKTHISWIISSGENTRLWSLNLQISIILFGNVIIIKYIFINNLKYHPFLDRQLTIQTFAYYLIYPGTRKVFCEWKFDLSCSIEIYHFDGLLSCAKQNITQNYFWCKIIQKAFHPHRIVVYILSFFSKMLPSTAIIMMRLCLQYDSSSIRYTYCNERLAFSEHCNKNVVSASFSQ